MTFLVTLSPLSRDGLLWKSPEHHIRWKQFVQDNNGKTVRIELPKSTRSHSQNNYYWFYLGVIERETGNNADDLHHFFKEKLLPKREVVVKGKNQHSIMVPRSTTSLSKVEFGEYLDKIAAITNVPLPNPEEAGFITNY